MNKLSVAIITYNEEANIQRCIESVQPIADEIIVVDSFSTDNTKLIAEKLSAKVIEHPFEGHIQQKNYALSQTSYDFVLSLDADEALSKKALQEVSKIKQKFSFSGYSFNRKTSYCGQWINHCGWYPDKKNRLVNRKVAKWSGENPHDKLMLEENTPTKHINADILHYSFPSIASHATTANKFSEIAAQQGFEKGKKIYFFIHILLNPFFTFVKKYFLQKGFLDGYYGFVICMLSAHSNFLKYSKMWTLKKQAKQK